MRVERVDYVRVPVTDIEQAKHFYGELLGLRENPNSPSEDWIEYEAGNVTLAVMTPHTHEYEFAPLPPSTIALRVDDVAAAKTALEAAGLEPLELPELLPLAPAPAPLRASCRHFSRSAPVRLTHLLGVSLDAPADVPPLTPAPDVPPAPVLPDGEPEDWAMTAEDRAKSAAAVAAVSVFSII